MTELVRSGADYRAGYASGIIAAADALLADLENAGQLTATEVTDDGQPAVCKTCALDAAGFHALTDRLDFALTLKPEETTTT